MSEPLVLRYAPSRDRNLLHRFVPPLQRAGGHSAPHPGQCAEEFLGTRVTLGAVGRRSKVSLRTWGILMIPGPSGARASSPPALVSNPPLRQQYRGEPPRWFRTFSLLLPPGGSPTRPHHLKRTKHPGKEPTARLARLWDVQAWEQQRPYKAEAGVLDDELTLWAARITEVMAEHGITLPTQPAADLGGRVSVAVLDRDGVAAEIVEAQGLKRSAWSRADLEAAAILAVEGRVHGDAAALDEAAADVAARALAVSHLLPGVATGVPSAAVKWFTSTAVVARENELRAGLAVLAAADRLTVVEGAAGAGKTTSLTGYLAQAGVAGQQVMLVAPTGAAANVAAGEVGAESSTIDKFLMRYGWAKNRAGGWKMDRTRPHAGRRAAGRRAAGRGRGGHGQSGRRPGPGDYRHRSWLAGAPPGRLVPVRCGRRRRRAAAGQAHCRAGPRVAARRRQRRPPVQAPWRGTRHRLRRAQCGVAERCRPRTGCVDRDAASPGVRLRSRTARRDSDRVGSPRSRGSRAGDRRHERADTAPERADPRPAGRRRRHRNGSGDHHNAARGPVGVGDDQRRRRGRYTRQRTRSRWQPVRQSGTLARPHRGR